MSDCVINLPEAFGAFDWRNRQRDQREDCVIRCENALLRFYMKQAARHAGFEEPRQKDAGLKTITDHVRLVFNGKPLTALEVMVKANAMAPRKYMLPQIRGSISNMVSRGELTPSGESPNTYRKIHETKT